MLLSVMVSAYSSSSSSSNRPHHCKDAEQASGKAKVLHASTTLAVD